MWRQTNDKDSERGNPLPPHGLLFPIRSKGSIITTTTTTTTTTNNNNNNNNNHEDDRIRSGFNGSQSFHCLIATSATGVTKAVV